MVDFIEIYDDVITSKQCDGIIQYLESNPKKKAGYPPVKNSTECPDNYFSRETYIDRLISPILLDNVRLYAEKYKSVDLVEQWGLDNLYNIQKYDIGKGYDFSHCENGGWSLMRRQLVWSIYLNTVNGGTHFDEYDRTVEAVSGRLLIFPAGWTHTHRGIICHDSVKYITTGWFSIMDKTQPLYPGNVIY